MMNEAVNGGGSKGIVIIENRSPVSEGPVGGHHDGATFIPVRDDLEEEFSPWLIHGEIAEFVNHEESGRGEGFHGLEERVVSEGGRELVDQIHGGAKGGFDSLQTSLIGQGQSQMSFSCSRRPHEDSIVFLFDEMEVKEAHDLRLIDGFGEREIEGVHGFEMKGEKGLFKILDLHDHPP